jgi:hypothetical protein
VCNNYVGGIDDDEHIVYDNYGQSIWRDSPILLLQAAFFDAGCLVRASCCTF